MPQETFKKNSGFNELLSFYQIVCKDKGNSYKDIRKRFAGIKNGDIFRNTNPVVPSGEIKVPPAKKETSQMTNAYENLRSQYEIIRKSSCRY